jgi:hypothetical protein
MTRKEKIRHLTILKQEQERYMIEVANAEQTIFDCNLKIEALEAGIKSLTFDTITEEEKI